MNRKLKGLLSLAIILSMILSMSMFVNAAVKFEQEDGLSVTTDGIPGIKITTTTDKESYKQGDKIHYIIKIENTSDKDISDVTLSYQIEGNATIKKTKSTFDLIKAGESKMITVQTSAITTSESADSHNYVFIIVIAAVIVAAVVVIVLILKKNNKKSKKKGNIDGIISGLLVFAFLAGSVASALAPVYVVNAEEKAYEVSNKDFKKTSVHDPSIVLDPTTGTYYIFGSHMAWAKSTDLKKWNSFKMNINSDYEELFGDVWNNFCYTDTNSKMSGNFWAPDVIFNKEMNKWCMYMSVNGDSHHSAIVLLTADNIEGPYEYIDEVVFSGVNGTAGAPSDEVIVMKANKKVSVGKDDFTLKITARFKESASTMTRLEFSDMVEVLGSEAEANNNRYKTTDYSKINAIDPCVYYGEDGNLYMVYGSWSAGIFQLQLDTKTGLRDKNVKYESVKNVSDAYLGVKIAGGFYNSGEGAYIQYNQGYYYLFISLGNLETSGGYNMRIYRSENPNGPYKDMNGNSPIYTGWDSSIGFKEGNTSNKYNSRRGLKIFGSYMFYGLDSKVQTAQGHNSAFVDADGKMYLVYHTRYAKLNGTSYVDDGQGHNVRVHQLFVNEDGWLVAAPYEYSGETLPENGYSVDKIVGNYEFVTHLQSKVYASGDASGIMLPVNITLNADGTITGDKNGTWKITNGANVEMVIDNVTYKGVFIEQANELATRDITMTFTLAGGNQTVWGIKNPNNN